MTQQVAKEFNSLLYGTLSKYERYYLSLADRMGKIYLCHRFIYLCVGREGREELKNSWGVRFNDLAIISKTGGIYYRNPHTPCWFRQNDKPDSYPCLYYQKKFGHPLTRLQDVGRGCETVEEVKQTVRDWIFDKVVPLHLEHLFTS